MTASSSGMSSKAAPAATNRCVSKPNSNSKNDGKRKKSPCRPNNRATEEGTILELISASLKRSDADALELRSKTSVLDQVTVIQRDISDLRNTILGMETKMSLICRELPLASEMRPEAIAESDSGGITGVFHNLEIRLAKAESLITRLVEEVAEQNRKQALRDETEGKL